jgi:hypothetical protein
MTSSIEAVLSTPNVSVEVLLKNSDVSVDVDFDTALSVEVSPPSPIAVECSLALPGPEYTPPSSPTFTYVDGLLTQISYGSGGTKTLTWVNGALQRIDFVKNGITTRKTLIWSNFRLQSIEQVTL